MHGADLLAACVLKMINAVAVIQAIALIKVLSKTAKAWSVIEQCSFALFVLLKSIRVRVIFQIYLIL